MIYILGLIVAAQIVLGQVFWKLGVEKYQFELSKDFIMSTSFLKFVFSPQILSGIAIYGIATLLFMGLLGKFDYSKLQSVVVSSSLILTSLAAVFIFKESINIYNIFGFVVIIIGVVLVTRL